MALLIELQYFPPVSYFSLWSQHSQILIEAQENYPKQTYRNRCRILTANGIQNLIVPVVHTQPKIPIREVKIDYSQNWSKQHWGAIVAAYAKAPYFEYLADDVKSILDKKIPFLFDLNWEILTLCLKWLRLNPTIELTERYLFEVTNGHFDARSTIHPKKSGVGNNLEGQTVYTQNFGNEFVSHLSILDVLMCQGIKATDIVKTT